MPSRTPPPHTAAWMTPPLTWRTRLRRCNRYGRDRQRAGADDAEGVEEVDRPSTLGGIAQAWTGILLTAGLLTQHQNCCDCQRCDDQGGADHTDDPDPR